MHILCILIFYLPAIFAQNCERLPTQIDKGFRELFFFGKTLPTSAELFSQHCRRNRLTLQQIKSYGSNCVTGLSAQLVNIMHHGGLKAAKKMCASNKIEEMANTMQCLKNEDLKALQKCYIKNEKMLDFISKRVHEDNIISALCCSIRINFDCINKILFEDCNKNLNFKDIVHDTFTLVFDELMDFMCQSFLTLDDCKEKKSSITNRLLKINSTSISKIKAQGIINPIIRIVNKLS